MQSGRLEFAAIKFIFFLCKDFSLQIAGVRLYNPVGRVVLSWRRL